MTVFSRIESNVRSYCRVFPKVFTKAYGATLEDENGFKYIDFFAGASSLNYGHNNPQLKERLLAYLNLDGITHSLDLNTGAKREFLETFEKIILKPRQLNYKIQFPGPTGTNAVEAALKITRKVTGRHNIISFSNAFHGMTLGALAATANSYYRNGAGIPSMGVTFMPYDGYLGANIDTTEYLDKVLCDRSSGLDIPAAVIVETIQAEGGINVASFDWLRSLEKVCQKHDILLIVDDIQVGCGRTGTFFSFEEANISPDVVILSKSLSGFGLPLSLVLMKPELDCWKPGEHNGTFRGNNLAFVTAKAALEHYWQDDSFSISIEKKGRIIRSRWEQMAQIAENQGKQALSVRGRGMILGFDCQTGDLASKITTRAFEKGLVIETCGSQGQVIKFLSPLTISEEELDRGTNILAESVAEVINQTTLKK